MLVAPEIFRNLANFGAFGMPENQAGADLFRDAEQVQVTTDAAVVPFFGFFQACYIILQFFGGFEGRAVNSLEHLTVFVTAPVSTGDGKKFNRFGGLPARYSQDEDRGINP